jgi:hypothetical protein
MSWGRLISSTGRLHLWLHSSVVISSQRLPKRLLGEHVSLPRQAFHERIKCLRLTNVTAAQLILTVLALFITVFLLGFVGDLILDLYFDPWGTLSGARPDFSYYDDEPPTWAEHFLKGGASLGLLSFFKFFFSPTRLFFRWGGGGGGGRPGRGGRERLADVSLILVVIGVATFLFVSIAPA